MTARFLQMDTPLGLGPDELILERFSGEESLSRPYSFSLGFWSSKTDIKATDLIGKSVTVTITSQAGDERIFNGIVRQLQGGELSGRGMRAYQLELVPSLRLLAETSNSRIFENKSAVDIVGAVLGEHSVSYREAAKIDRPTREYCVQYRETDLNFVSRLLEEEGIFYFFEHQKGQHTLVLAEKSTAYQDCPDGKLIYSSGTKLDASVSSWDRSFEFVPGKWTLSDYNFETPQTSLKVSISTTARVGDNSSYEMYDYPGLYSQRTDGTTLSQLRMEEEETLFETARARTRVMTLFPSGKFMLEEHEIGSESGKSWAIVSVRHDAHDDSQLNAGGSQGYGNEILAIPADTVFRPRRMTPKPYIHGLQTAVVTGPDGEEIFVDKYGRVKVLFFWDRDKSNSCWIRVAQGIAGRNWGMQYLPRIGQEVVVSFLEGDPDRPLITGSVYNADNMPPYALPANKTQSGFKTRSSKSGGADNFNELRFEDEKGSEDIVFHAEKDFHREVEHDDNLKVGNDQVVEITNNRTETVKNGNETVTVKTGNRAVTVETGNDSHEIKQGNRDVKISMGNDSLEISMGNQTTKLSLGSSSTEAMQSITLKVGGNSITIDQTGITIKGLMVSIEGQTQTQVKGLMTQINGDAMLQLKGGITMIG